MELNFTELQELNFTELHRGLTRDFRGFKVYITNVYEYILVI